MSNDAPAKVVGQLLNATIRFVLFSTVACCILGSPLLFQVFNRSIPGSIQWDALSNRAVPVCVISLKTAQGFPIPRNDVFESHNIPYDRLITHPDVGLKQAQEIAKLYPALAPIHLFVSQLTPDKQWVRVYDDFEVTP
jgi:hypothetical protein